uniref:Uncharacterized protein n=1 Tax=Arundo donax TaxID=35708 RepID=A0A0A9E3J3_ARUDO
MFLPFFTFWFLVLEFVECSSNLWLSAELCSNI